MSQSVSVACHPVPDGFLCDVVVGRGTGATRHAVTVRRTDLARLAPGHYDPQLLVAASFEFLLAREPREAILRTFELPVIERYFPGWEEEMRRALGG